MENRKRLQQLENQENVDHFKDDLFQKYQNSGIVDNLKAQLRYKLVDKLQRAQTIQPDSSKIPADQIGRKKVLASLVKEYLEFEQFSYSQNVFLPECGFQNQIMNRDEILERWQATDIFADQKSSLLSNLYDLMSGPQNDTKQKRVYKTNSSTQTDHGDSIMNLESKLNTVDYQWKKKIESELIPNAATIEERMERFKRDYEARMKADMEAEVTRIRNFELANIRLEESQKCQVDMQEYREELDRKYQDKLNRLRDREKQTLDRCAQKMKDLETYNHDHRQKILKDFELLKLREDGVEKQEKLNNEKLNLEQSKLETLQRDLRKKIKELDETKFYQEKHQENEKSMAKIEVYKEVQNEQLEYIEKKKKVESELFKIDSMKENIEQLKAQNKQLSDENSSYVQRIDDIKEKYKDHDHSSRQVKDNFDTVTESYRREQQNVKNLEEQIRIKNQEIQFLKQALEGKDDQMQLQKTTQIDQIKKMNNEIHSYQQQIEKLEKQQKDVKKQLVETEEMVQKGVGQPISYLAYKHQDPNESLTLSKLNQSQMGQKNIIEMERLKLKEEREMFISKLTHGNEFSDQTGYKVKFQNSWEQENSMVNLSQMPTMPKKEINRRQQQQQSYMESDAYRSQTQDNQYQQQPPNFRQQPQQQQQQQQFQQQQSYQDQSGILDKVDIAQSMSYDKSPHGLNLIEQAQKQMEIQKQSEREKSIPQEAFKKPFQQQQEEEPEEYQPTQTFSKPSRGKRIFEDIHQYRDDKTDTRYAAYAPKETIQEQKSDFKDKSQADSHKYSPKQSSSQKKQEPAGFKFSDNKREEKAYQPSSYTSQLPQLTKPQPQQQSYFNQSVSESGSGFKSEAVDDILSSQKKQSDYDDEVFEEIVEDLDD